MTKRSTVLALVIGVTIVVSYWLFGAYTPSFGEFAAPLRRLITSLIIVGVAGVALRLTRNASRES